MSNKRHINNPKEEEEEEKRSYEGKRSTVATAVRLRSTGNIYMTIEYQVSYKYPKEEEEEEEKGEKKEREELVKPAEQNP